MKTIFVVIHMECDGETSWLKCLGELWPTQSVDQWFYFLTNPSSREKVPNIDWLVAVFPGTNKIDGRPDPIINSWEQLVNALSQSRGLQAR